MNDLYNQLITPKNIQVNQNSNQLIIIRKWLNKSTFVFTGYTIFFNGFVFFLFWAFNSSSGGITSSPFLLAFFSLFLCFYAVCNAGKMVKSNLYLCH